MVRRDTPLVIVDDDPLFGRIVSDFFSERGYAPTVARTARAGETAVRELQPPVALVDIYLEDGDGLALCGWIREHSPDTSTLLMTARPEAFARGDGVTGVIDDFFVKSNDLGELARRVAARVDQADALKALRRRERLLAAVAQIAQATAAYVDLAELAKLLAPLMIKIPGVRGARIQVQGVGKAGDVVTLLDAGLPVGRGDEVDAIPLEDDGHSWLSLRMEGPDRLDRDVVATLARLLSAAIAAARTFEAFRTRQIRLEHGYAARQRQLGWIQSRLERMTEARDSMVALLSHDLRSPLAVILGHCQLVDEGGYRPEQVRKSVETIRRQSERMNKMVEALLDRYRVDPSTTAEIGDIGELAREMIPLLEPVAARGRQTLTLEVATPAPVEADLHEIRNAFANLVENALRHSPEGGVVSIRVATEDESVVILIRDRGPGFGTTAAPGGSGLSLGLNAARQTIATSGGTLVAENHPEGGALVRIELPLAQDRSGREWILLTGRDVQRLDYLSEGLMPGWETSVVVDVNTVRHRVRRQPPSVVIIDVDENQDDVGYDVLRMLKSEPDLAIIPVIAVVPPAGAVWVERLNRLGAYAVLRRPLEPSRLADRVRAALREVRDAETSVMGRRCDPLTGAETVDFLLARAPTLIDDHRSVGTPLPIIVVDLPGLPDVNLTWGWAIGDLMLVWIAKALTDRCAPGEWCVRSAGGRFLVITKSRTMEAATIRAEEIRRYIASAQPRLGVARVPVHVTTRVVDAVTESAHADSWTALVRGNEEA